MSPFRQSEDNKDISNLNLNTVDRLKKELVTKSLYQFAKMFWSTVEPAPLKDHWLLKYYAELFQFVVRRYLPAYIKEDWKSEEEINDIKKRLQKMYPDYNVFAIDPNKRNISLNVPPRHTKSLFINVIAAVWLVSIIPLEVASVSHTQRLSNTLNAKRQKLMNSDLYKKLFGEVVLTENTKAALKTDNGISLYNIAYTSMLGFGFDILNLDDLIDSTDAKKQQENFKTAMDFLQHTMPSRANNPLESIIFNIQQRLAINDPTGFFMETAPDTFNFITIPSEFQENTIYIMPCSGQFVICKEGEYLWPERFGDYSIQKTLAGESIYKTQYLQLPGSESSYAKEEYFIGVTPDEVNDILDDPDFEYASHDLPIKDKESSDLMGSIKASYKNNKLVIEDVFEGKMSFTKQKQYIINLGSSLRGLIQLLEDKANAPAVMDELQGEVTGLIPFSPGLNSKATRLEMAISRMISKNVVFLKSHWNPLLMQWEYTPEMKKLIQRILDFPNVKHDDIVDAFSQLVIYVFTKKQAGILSKSISNDNIIGAFDSSITKRQSGFTAAVLREGNAYKMLKSYYDPFDDIFYFFQENTFRGNIGDAIVSINKFTEDCDFIIDATKENIIYNNFIHQIPQLLNQDDNRALSQQHTQIASGLEMNKIKFVKELVEMRQDMDTLSYNRDQLEKGIEKVEGSEGYVACMKTIIYFHKGDSEFIEF